MAYDEVKFEDMIGKTFTNVEHLPYGHVADSDAIVFTVSEDEKYAMFYVQECCANCSVEDICGELDDLVDSPIVRAEENTNEEEFPARSSSDESFTWTFYRIGTRKGTVVIRWYGSSNGYYSESASFGRIK